jgi:hypothetical protein
MQLSIPKSTNNSNVFPTAKPRKHGAWQKKDLFVPFVVQHDGIGVSTCSIFNFMSKTTMRLSVASHFPTF